MSTSSNRPSRGIAAWLLALLVPTLVVAGVVGTDIGRTGASAVKPPPGGYTLRCWQDGKLILEEQHVSLPPVVDAASTRLQVLDSKQQPIVIAETRNATCMVKARPAERSRSVLP